MTYIMDRKIIAFVGHIIKIMLHNAGYCRVELRGKADEDSRGRIVPVLVTKKNVFVILLLIVSSQRACFLLLSSY